MTEEPPRGLSWTVAPVGRLLVLSLAMASLLISIYVGYRYTTLVDCLNERDLADQSRTSAIAGATDAEREADLRLLIGEGDPEQLRRDSVAAREATSQVRARYPAPAVQPCR